MKHWIGVGNVLEALHLILYAYDIGQGDEVIVPVNTYIATWLAVSYAGAAQGDRKCGPGALCPLSTARLA